MGVSDRAAERVRELDIAPHKVFAHPDLLVSDPRLLEYYRNLALLPEKGLRRLAFGTKGLEAGRGRLSEQRARVVARVLNEMISAQIEADAEWTPDKAQIAALLNLGSLINGSWRNAIGEEGGRQIRALLASLLIDEGVVAKIVFPDGREVPPPVDAAEAVMVRQLDIQDGSRITFSAEPDVSFRNRDGVLNGTIEVKYGSDPAGALERYGAARKSFEAAVQENARVQNLYIANALTAEVRRRINADRLVTEVFEFTRITLDKKERERFGRFVIRRLLDV